MTTDKIQEIKLSEIELASWNPNEMSPEKFEALKQDLKENGQLYPVIVMKQVPDPAKVKAGYGFLDYIVVEGNHRVKAAQALKWKTIKAEMRAFKSEAEAMIMNFRANSDRGQHDPFKEARLFQKLLAAAGKTQERLALELQVDRTTISKRVSLLKVDYKVREELRRIVPQITTSHFELLSPLDPKAQAIVVSHLKRYNLSEGVSVRRLAEECKYAQEELVEQLALLEALKTAKFPKCPRCKGAPSRITYRGLPWVEGCNGGDSEWNIKTGKRYDYMQQLTKDERKTQKKKVPQFVRTKRSQEDFAKAFSNYLKKTVPQLDEIGEIKVEGKKAGKDVSFSMSTHGQIWFFEADGLKKGEDGLSLAVEKKEYSSPELKDIKATILASFAKSEKDLEKAEKEAEAFLRKYAR